MPKPVTKNNRTTPAVRIQVESRLRFLSPNEILMIDDMLHDVKPFGEVTLRVKDGKLKFAAESKSYDALKLQRPNALEEELNDGK